MPPLTIALAILHADPARGGAERYTVDLATALVRRGHEVSLLAASFAGEWPGVRCVPIGFDGATRTRRYNRFLDGLDEHLDHERYEIVHAMLPVRRCDVYHPHAGMAAAALEKPNALFNPRRRAMAAVERKLLTSTTSPIVIALSEYVKRSIRQHYPLGESRWVTLFNAVDLQRFDPNAHAATRPSMRAALGLPKDRATALFIGHDYERKGLAQAIGMMKNLQSGPTLVVVGPDPSREFAGLVAAAGIGDRVQFTGPSSDAVPYYAAADFFVLPTRHDPCSLVVLEALAMGLPVISTKFNGACEIMTNGVHGYVLDQPSDVEALAEAARQLLDPERRRAMSAACLELRPRLSFEHHLDQLMDIYERARTSRCQNSESKRRD